MATTAATAAAVATSAFHNICHIGASNECGHSSLLVIGASDSGKTSVLFSMAAHAVALDSKAQALFVCRSKDKLRHKMPAIIKPPTGKEDGPEENDMSSISSTAQRAFPDRARSPPHQFQQHHQQYPRELHSPLEVSSGSSTTASQLSKTESDRICIAYARTFTELVRVLSAVGTAFHPTFVAVDDLDHYLDGVEANNRSRLCALLQFAVAPQPGRQEDSSDSSGADRVSTGQDEDQQCPKELAFHVAASCSAYPKDVHVLPWFTDTAVLSPVTSKSP